MTSHWPTFADGLFWCACENRTFDSEEAWQAHVVKAWLTEQGLGITPLMPSETADELPYRGA